MALATTSESQDKTSIHLIVLFCRSISAVVVQALL